MAMYRIKQRKLERVVYDESNYWQQLRPHQRLQADLDEYAQLNALAADEPPDAPIPNTNPWRHNRLLGALGLLAALGFVLWMFSDYLGGGSLLNPALLSRSRQLAQQQALADLQQAVVSIECGGSIGSGFNIAADGLIVTNAHVVAGHDTATLFFPQGEQRVFVSRQITLIEGVDLALVDIEGQDLPCVELADYFPAAQQEVIFIGNPLGYDWTICEGLVLGELELGEQPVIWLQAPVQPGSSGSPLFDADSRVIGVIFASLRDQENNGLAIPISYLTDHLNQTKTVQ